MNSTTVGQALRRLVRTPGFTVPVLLLLALGLGASATMFAVVDGVLLEPLPLPDSKELVVLCEQHPSVEGYCVGSVPTTRDLGRAAASLETAGAARGWSYSYEDGGEVEGVSGGIAAPEFFDALEVQPALGRLFAPDEIGPDRDDVLVLSHAFWTRRYGADPGVLNRTVRLDGEPVEIVGVLPEGLEVPTLEWVEVWRPLHVDPAVELNRGWRGFTALGRLAPGATVESAQAELSSLYRSLGTQHEAIGDDWRLRVRTLQDEIVGSARRPLWAFLGGVLLLLLIASANVASLVVARLVARWRDAAIRAALGAGARTLVGEVVVEGGLLALLATLLGLVLAVGGLRVLLAYAPPGVPRLDNVGLDASVFVFAALLAGFTVLVFALAAAVRARAPIGAALGSARPAGLDVRGMGPHRWLVAGEVALSVVLVFTSLLLARSLMGFLGWDPGIDLDRVVVVPAIASSGVHATGADVMRFWRQAEEELDGLPGVAAAGTGSSVPLRGGIERAQIRI
ncbi:MAG TPA: ABC transporter permease, partial [Longimicrobiales bacterium]|nr:ABC transporter permease [Longimicrobiales bacterium]